jgi:hypothetical protein
MQTEAASLPGTLQRYRRPIWTLLILAPVISEVLSGSTRLSVLFVLIPEVMTWGCGALLCRELIRRWRGSAISLLLLGLALAVAEEFIIQQTSLAPLPFPGANAAYGRHFGVNWIYFLFMLGFESVWVVLVPVQVTELCFPQHRSQPWLRKRGLIATCLVFLIGCRMAWYGWTQQALKRMGVPPYHPTLATISVGFASISMLVLFAYLLRTEGHTGRITSRSAANLWLIGILAFVFAAAWWTLMVLVFSPHPPLPASIAFAAGTLWGILAFLVLLSLSSGTGWTDLHRWAAAFGATLACMLPGYLSLSGWTLPDLVFKIVVNVVALVGFLMLAARIRNRRAESALQNR